jgi:hypothetical protein
MQEKGLGSDGHRYAAPAVVAPTSEQTLLKAS